MNESMFGRTRESDQRCRLGDDVNVLSQITRLVVAPLVYSLAALNLLDPVQSTRGRGMPLCVCLARSGYFLSGSVIIVGSHRGPPHRPNLSCPQEM